MSKKYSYKNKSFKLKGHTRKEQKNHCCNEFNKEEAGYGKDDKASRYRYKFCDYKQYEGIFKRPTQNGGYDFKLHIIDKNNKDKKIFKNINKNGKDTFTSAPTHNNIVESLISCKKLHPKEYQKVEKTVNDIFLCNILKSPDINACFLDYNNEKHPISLILDLLTYLFIEQDIKYWLLSGRNSLYAKLVYENAININDEVDKYLKENKIDLKELYESSKKRNK